MGISERNVHLIGAGGIGMSGVGMMMLREGVRVTGSDAQAGEATARLEAMGAKIAVGNRAENIAPETELVVISAAIKPENPELVEARRRGIPVQKYAQVLGRLMRQFKGIAISGTHGKTTTTAMTASMLKEAGLNPSFVIGAVVGGLGGSSGAGTGEHFVVEACEYDRSFLNLHPWVAVINNIEEDHLDYYRDLGEIVGAFGQFASQVAGDGLLLVNAADARAREAAKRAVCEVQTFGVETDADWQATRVTESKGQFGFEAAFHGKTLGSFGLGIPGRHNVGNALAAIACACRVGVEADVAGRVLAKFRGADRRFQKIGEVKGITIIDDYAHHPTEIQVTLDGARKFFAARRIWTIFQPHQHSRTRFFLEEFAQSFTHTDVVIVPGIYFVRDSEADRRAVTAEDLVKKMKVLHRDARLISDFDEIVQVLKKELKPGDVVITMGAGNVNEVGRRLLKALGNDGQGIQRLAC